MFALITFRNVRWFPVFTILAYYLLQGIFGLLVFPTESQPREFLVLLFLSIFGYLVGAFLLFKSETISRVINNKRRVKINVSNVAIVVFGFYFLMMLFVALTSKEIALFAALRGASIGEIAHNREELLRTRTGWQASLKYFYAIFNYFIIPYCIVMLFSIRHRLRFIILVIFLFTLLLTLEKSITLMALLPLVVFYMNKVGRGKSMMILFALIMMIVGASFLARGGLSADLRDTPELMETVTSDSAIFDTRLQSLYIANRVLWIPYVTALDWLRYQDQVLHGKFNYGRSIGIVSYLTGQPFIYMEREVFAFEWGQNETGTGSANTAYFIDGFVNFGYPGVILYAMVLGLITRIIFLSDNVPGKSVAYIPLFYLAANSLSAVLFSGGLIFLLLVLVCLKAPNVKEVSNV